MRSIFWIALAMLLAYATASHRTIQLDSSGFYRGLVVGFSSDFRIDKVEDQVKAVESLMAHFQTVSDILHNLLGVRIGEMTIVLPDNWSITDRLNVTEDTYRDVQRRTLSEADFIFTDDPSDLNIEQILTMQWGECGEPGTTIQFPKKYFSDKIAPRLLAHQWLLYRYGVFNEFGFVDDHTYPVYFRPIDGGELDPTKTKSLPNSCADKNDYNILPICQNMDVDPNTGLPLNPKCDLVPNPNSLHSSFLYAPLAVSDSDYHICNASSHNYLAPNKQNAMCDNQSPLTIIGAHADFEDFPLGGRPNVPPAFPIKFKIWSRYSPSNRQLSGDEQLAHIFYALPKGFKFSGSMLGMTQKFSEIGIFNHMAKAAFYSGDSIDKTSDNWKPSANLPTISSSPDSTNIVNLSSIFNNILFEFKTPSSRSGGAVVFVLSGNYSVTSMEDPNIVIEKLAEKLNLANIALRVLVVDRIPDKIVVRFFDQLVKRLIAGKSSVHYAVSSSPTDSNAQSRVYSEMMTFWYDSLQYSTEQSHILLKRESFSVENSKEIQLKFSIDSGFSNSSMRDRWLLVELYSTQPNQMNLGKARLYTAHDHSNVLSSKYTDGREPHVGYLIFKAEDLRAGNEYMFNTQVNQNKVSSSVAVSIRMLSNFNSFRSFYSEAPVTGSCWVQSALNHFPIRGYAQLGQGLNGPVFEADVTMIVRRFTTSGLSTVQEFNIPLGDNGRAAPDLAENDGIYSSYLDSILTDLPDGDVVFQVSARVTSQKVSMKPANFGNTVLFSNRPRCCGHSLPSKPDDKVTVSQLDRILDCGSFHLSLNDQSSINRQSYAIRDLRIFQIDPDNRTVTIEWNSPFMPSTTSSTEQRADIKLFYSKESQSKLPLLIKEKFATEPNADIELVEEKAPMKRRSVNGPASLSMSHEAVPENILDSNAFNQDEEDGYSFNDNGPIVHEQRTLVQQHHEHANVPAGELANSRRLVTIKVKQPDAGYYFIAVQERDGLKQTRPSNVIAVYLKSNVQLDKNSAFAIEQGQMTDGPHRTVLDNAGLGWEMIILICVACALILFILILVAICFTIRRRRQNPKDSDVKEYEPASLKHTVHESTKTLDASRRAQQYYIGLQNGQQPDRSSLQSENGLSGHGSQGPASQHTSCTEVNQVHDNGTAGAQYYQQAQYQQPSAEHSPAISNKQMKELNVATLLPNSWDAKDLLDHWGRVQEAKQRQEMPGMLQTTAMPAHSTSDDDTPSPYMGQHSSQAPLYYPQAHHHHAQAYLYDGDEFYHQAHIAQQQPQHYSPYSNASSIWQHHQQQQQQQPQPQQQQQQQQQQHRMAFHNSQTSYPVGSYDESGLPEYSVVRKVPVVSPQPNPPNHANISQV